jgi:hypothetical protein
MQLTMAKTNQELDLVRMAHWLRSNRAAVDEEFKVARGMRDVQPVSVEQLRLLQAEIRGTAAQVKAVVSPGKALDAEGRERVVQFVVQSLAAHEAATRSARKSPKPGSAARKSPKPGSLARKSPKPGSARKSPR